MRTMRVLIISVVLVLSSTLTLADESLSREQMENFLRTAKVVSSKNIGKGVTHPYRLTLSDGTLTHDAAFQAVDEKKSSAQLAGGRTEINFVDSWRYNVAAYGLAVALGLGDMMPVTVERTWNGKTGALAWWLDTRMDEQERLKTKTNAPDPTAWNNEMHRLRLFTELVADTDRNLGNVLVSPDWHVLMIDFTRAFRIWDNIRPKELVRCDRALLARVEALTLDSVAEATGEYLTRYEREAVLKRRDKIVAHFKQLVAQMGEQRVLY